MKNEPREKKITVLDIALSLSLLALFSALVAFRLPHTGWVGKRQTAEVLVRAAACDGDVCRTAEGESVFHAAGKADFTVSERETVPSTVRVVTADGRILSLPSPTERDLLLTLHTDGRMTEDGFFAGRHLAVRPGTTMKLRGECVTLSVTVVRVRPIP